MYKVTKKKVHTLLHPEIGETKGDRLVNVFIIILILLNVIAVMLETVPSIHDPYKTFFFYFDSFSVFVFSIEYILRVWSCTNIPKYRHPVRGRLRYMLSAGALLDLIAILPFFLQVLVGFDLRVLRIFRLLRFLRLFRLTAYMKATKLVINVFKSKINELVLSLVLVLFLLIISSCLIYFAEHPAQPAMFSSIPATIWWSITTLTTVGYGDMVPVTALGRLLTGIVLLAAVVLFALPAGIITAGFLEEVKRSRSHKPHNCPHCGLPIEESDPYH
jgi:voltage-gated potassium channel